MRDITSTPPAPRRPYGTLSNAIYRLRINRQLTQVQLARQIDVSQPAVASYESGRIMPSEETLRKMAYVLNVSYDLLACHKRTLFAPPKHGP